MKFHYSRYFYLFQIINFYPKYRKNLAILFSYVKKIFAIKKACPRATTNSSMLIDNGKKIVCVQSKFKSCHMVKDFTRNSDIIIIAKKFACAIDSQLWSRFLLLRAYFVLSWPFES